MRKVIDYSILVTGAALIILLASFALSEDSGSAFWNNFLLNVVAELLGLALTLKIALWLASEKLNELARPLVRLIAQLRIGDTISKKAARSCVICAVGFISEDHLSNVRPKNSGESTEEHCAVCALQAKCERQANGYLRCAYCGLQGDVWINLDDDIFPKDSPDLPSESYE